MSFALGPLSHPSPTEGPCHWHQRQRITIVSAIIYVHLLVPALLLIAFRHDFEGRPGNPDLVAFMEEDLETRDMQFLSDFPKINDVPVI